MYRRILVALENSRADESLLPHITELAGRLGSELLLIHVADGFAARHFEELKADRAYLARHADELTRRGLRVQVHLAMGNPPVEIVKAAEQEHCDLIAMTTHGHRFFGDIIHGSTITAVRHKTQIPILLVRAKGERS